MVTATLSGCSNRFLFPFFFFFSLSILLVLLLLFWNIIYVDLMFLTVSRNYSSYFTYYRMQLLTCRRVHLLFSFPPLVPTTRSLPWLCMGWPRQPSLDLPRFFMILIYLWNVIGFFDLGIRGQSILVEVFSVKHTGVLNLSQAFEVIGIFFIAKLHKMTDKMLVHLTLQFFFILFFLSHTKKRESRTKKIKVGL